MGMIAAAVPAIVSATTTAAPYIATLGSIASGVSSVSSLVGAFGSSDTPSLPAPAPLPSATPTADQTPLNNTNATAQIQEEQSKSRQTRRRRANSKKGGLLKIDSPNVREPTALGE